MTYPRSAGGDVAVVAAAVSLLAPAPGLAPACAFVAVAVLLLVLLGAYGSAARDCRAWEGLVAVIAVSGGLAAAALGALAVGVAVRPDVALALWACAAAGLRARQIATRMESVCPAPAAGISVSRRP